MIFYSFTFSLVFAKYRYLKLLAMNIHKVIERSSTPSDFRTFSNLSISSALLCKSEKQWLSQSSNTLYCCHLQWLIHEYRFQNSDSFGYRNGSSNGSGASSYTPLAPPMPPIAPAARLRRANSSTLSLTKNKRKMLTVNAIETLCYPLEIE